MNESETVFYVCLEGIIRKPFFLLVVMAHYGKHYCKNPSAGYYAGWDDLGIENEEACKELCRRERLCRYAASKPGHTCSRYKGGLCELFTDLEVTEDQKGHITFKKLDNTPSSHGKLEIYYTRPVIQINVCKYSMV